jgi:hypothetical protein
MTLAQWIYIKPDMMTSQDHPTTFVIIVDVDMRDQYKKDPSIPLAAVVDSFDVLVSDIDLIRLLTFCTIHIPNAFFISFINYYNWTFDIFILPNNVPSCWHSQKYDSGQSGKLVRPSKAELKDAFGTTNHEEIIVFMLEHGHCHGKPKVSNGEPGARTRNGKYAAGLAY